MKAIQAHAQEHADRIIHEVEEAGVSRFMIDNEEVELHRGDVDIIPVDIPGWKVLNDGALTVALDVNVTEELRQEGIAREFVNRIQNLRKDIGLEVTDKIKVTIQAHQAFNEAVKRNSEYIRGQILAGDIQLVESVTNGHPVEIDEGVTTLILIEKLN